MKPTVTIGVCVYNEAENIEKFLFSVLGQSTKRYDIKNIVVISDGSTDNTSRLVRKLKVKYPIISFVDHPTRIGKSSHLNLLYKNLKTDFLLQTDGDVVFANPYVVDTMLMPMSTNKRLFMTCGKPVPVKADTYIERGQNMVYLTLCEMHKPLRGGQNALIADGRILAYKTTFIKNVIIPHDMIANDVFTYFACRNRGLEAKYIPSAIVYFRGAQTIGDRIKQNARSAAVPLRMTRYFPKMLVQKEMHVPFSVSLKSKLKQFFRAPVLSVLLYAIHKYCQAKAVIYDRTLTAVWPIAYTTKRLTS